MITNPEKGKDKERGGGGVTVVAEVTEYVGEDVKSGSTWEDFLDLVEFDKDELRESVSTMMWNHE